jgi:hypothetical protein
MNDQSINRTNERKSNGIFTSLSALEAGKVSLNRMRVAFQLAFRQQHKEVIPTLLNCTTAATHSHIAAIVQAPF